MDPSPLRGRGLGHCPELHRCCRDILASAIEDRGLLAPFVIVDAVVDVLRPPPGCSAIAMTPLLLLESVSELLQKESVLFDLGLKLTKLLQVQALKFLVGEVLVPRYPGLDVPPQGVGSENLPLHPHRPCLASQARR